MDPSRKRLVREGSDGAVKFYLITYNSLQTIGWTLLLLQLCNYYISSNQENNSLYQNIKWPLLICQSAAALEIIHAVTGIVPSSPIFTSMQVLVRISMVHGIIVNVVGAQTCLGFSIAMLAWSLTEIVRYSYYALNLVNMVPYFLMWLRYSTFLILYPIGALGEFNCLYEGQKKFAETELWDNKLSNLVLLGLLYTPIFIRLYNHMLTQRGKVLGATEAINVTKIK